MLCTVTLLLRWRPSKIGSTKTATTENNVTKTKKQKQKREIADTVGISKDRVGHILHEILDMRKLSARWVPLLLTPVKKRNRETISEQCLTPFKRNPKEFLRRFVTVDETWIHWYTPETKQQLKQWISPNESAPKKAKTVPSAGKVMATLFWDSQGVILILIYLNTISFCNNSTLFTNWGID